MRTTALLPTLRHSLLALLKAAERGYGWCRTRRSCATLPLTLQAKRSITISAETMRRWWDRRQLPSKSSPTMAVIPRREAG